MQGFFQTVRFKIIAALSTAALLTLAVGLFGLSGIGSLSASLRNTYNDNIVPVHQITEARAAMLNLRLTMWRTIAKRDASLAKAAPAHIARVEKMWSEYYPAGVTAPEERAIADKLDPNLRNYLVNIRKEVTLLEQGDFDGASAYQTREVTPVGEVITPLFGELVDNNLEQARDNDVRGRERSGRLTWVATALICAAIVLSVAAAFYLLNAIGGPLAQSVAMANDIAQGRLGIGGQAAVGSVKGEFGLLLDAMHRMSDQLAGTVRGIRDASEAVSVAAGEIASGNMDLSTRTEQQASSLEETAASMTELTQTVTQNADNARQASQLAVQARDMTGNSSSEVESMVKTIGNISQSSAKIADITGLIDGIAFQTNILALNAAVEAARAGEQGRGFAVVAGEVRALAQRSSSAAREIKELIESSAGMVEQGAQQAVRVGASMEDVRQAIGKVTDIIGEIATASGEQSQGIEQVSQAISQIDSVTQQNAALVEESAAAAQSLQEQAGRMKERVAFFQVGGGQRVLGV